MLEPGPRPLVARALLDLLRAAEAAQRRMARLRRVHAALFVFRRLQLEVRAHFLGHLGVEFLLPEQCAELAEEFHDHSQRNATIGSTFAARRAGSQHASAATAASS